MPILVTCSNGHKLRVKDELAGKKVRCPKCKAVVQIPASEAVEESDELSVLMESDPGTAPPLRPASPRRPAPSKARPAQSKARGARRGAPRRAKSDGSPMKLVLAIGGAAAALGILAVVAVFVLGIGGGGGGDDDGIPGGIVDDRTAEQKANDQPPTESTQRPGQQTQRQTPPSQTGQPSRNRGQTQTAPGTVAAAELPEAPDVPNRPLDLSYVPNQAEVIISLRPAELAASPLIAQLLATPQARKSLAEMEQQLGLSISDIESLVIALPSLNDASSAAMAQAGAMGGAFSFGTASGAARAGGLPGAPGAPGVAPGQPSAAAVPPTIYVARTTKPFDPQKLLAQAEDSQQQQVEGTTYFRVRMPATATGGVPAPGAIGGPNRGTQRTGQPPSGGTSPPGGAGGASAQKQSEPVAVFFPDNQTAVFGTEELVQAAIRQGSSQAERPELASFNAGHHVLIAIAPQNGLAAAARAAPLAGNDPLLQALTQHGTALSLSFMVADNVFAYATVQCNDEQGAAQVLAAVNNSIQQLNAVAGGMKQNLPAPVTQIIDQVLGSLTAGQAENTVTVTAAIPAAAFNPQIWLSLMFSGMTGPGGNPLGAPQGNRQGAGGGFGAPGGNPQTGGATTPGSQGIGPSSQNQSATGELDTEVAVPGLEQYRIQPPKGYRVQKAPDTPSGVEVLAWVGPPRSDGTSPMVMISHVSPPPGAQRYSAEEALQKDLDSLRRSKGADFQATAAQPRNINGFAFVGAYWSGTHPRTGGKLHGFSFVAVDGADVVYLKSQDAEPHHEASLKLAEASAETFRKAPGQ